MKKIKKYTLIIGLSLASILSLGFVDNFFEISKNLDIFSSLYKELNIYYVDETDAGELMKTGIDAMLESLDPYTTYIPESEKEDFEFMTTGQYGGIGAIITKNGDWVYMSVSLMKVSLLIKLDLLLVTSLLKLLANLLKVSQLKMSVKC